MHYRNGRETKNDDTIMQLGEGGRITAFGTLQDAVPGNDYCNGNIVSPGSVTMACLCDCLHVDDVAALLVDAGLGQRPPGM